MAVPANLSPEYKEAEQAFKKAKTKEEKIAALEEMLAVIPKHKGTDRLQGELKKRLSKLRSADEPKAAAGPQSNPFLVEPQGAGQIVVLGFPNVGKSSLLKALTNAKAEVAEYPFTTAVPQPGMVPYLDVLIQLVDTPPVTEDGIPGSMMTTLQNADALMIMADMASDQLLDQLTETRDFLLDRRLLRDEGPHGVNAFTWDRVLWVSNKWDLPAAAEHQELLAELWDGPQLLPISAKNGKGLEELKRHCFQVLDVIRVYTKAPGREPDMETPFVLPRGSTVIDLAENIHKEVAEQLKGARVWGSAKFDGQNVAQDYALQDEDIVELKT